jgi:spore maturation protein CgeB
MYNKRQFRHYLSGAKYYNAHLSIHPFHKHELRSLKASNWVRTHLGFDPSICCPPFILKSAPKYSTDVIFVGHWEEHTEEHVSFLIDQGVNIKVWGMNWKKCRYKRHLSDHYRMEWIPDSEYAQAISSSKIALCFLSKCNRNQETGRSYEIPAIGTFMLGERTEDHLRLYEEGHEAEFFESSDELLEKIQFYLANETDRERIATFGKRRALTSGYTYFDRIKADLANLLPLYSSFRDSHL